MNKKKLTLGEIIDLEAEINGVINQQTGQVILKGLLTENIKLIIKYRLTKLAELLISDRKIVDEMRNDLIRKYGEEDDAGGIKIETYLDKDKTQINPMFTQFSNEYNTLLTEQKEIDFPIITLEDIKDIKGEGYYGVFLKLITEEEEKTN
jgi:hypothetical protein